MSADDRRAVWLSLGVFGAVTLGIVLIPLRALTPAANLAFAFLVLTIVVAELGGRAAAMTTAVVSAMSLNFFLIDPYLTLSIDKTDDLVAFVALAVCGLIAAAFGTRRVRSTAQADRSRWELDTLQRVARRVESGAAWDEVLDDIRGAFRLDRLALRDADERLLATSPRDARSTSIPTVQLEPVMLLDAADTSHQLGHRGFRLPDGGGRLRLAAAPGVSLDVWGGGGEGLNLGERRALGIAAAMLGLGLASRR